MANLNLGDYFKKFSQATLDAASGGVKYDNDGDLYNGCSATATSGVNIYFYTVSQSLIGLSFRTGSEDGTGIGR